jgi:hypothetical protein
MALIQIPNLPGAISALPDDLIEVVQAGTSKKMSLRQVASVANPWTVLTQAQYDALPTKDANTVYLIVG